MPSKLLSIAAAALLAAGTTAIAQAQTDGDNEAPGVGDVAPDAGGQLQGTDDSSNAAAANPSDEGAHDDAGQGFDTAPAGDGDNDTPDLQPQPFSATPNP
jgi:hypothetical protein